MSNDPVNHPEHYETNGIECIDAMVASQGKEAVSNYCVCNSFKYIWRHQHKGKSVEDIQKAIWYLNKYVELNEDHQEIDAYELIDDLSKLNPIFSDFFPYWENDYILSIYSNPDWMYYNSYPLYRFDFSKIAVQDIISAFASGDINSLDCDGIDKFV